MHEYLQGRITRTYKTTVRNKTLITIYVHIIISKTLIFKYNAVDNIKKYLLRAKYKQSTKYVLKCH